MPTQLPGRCTGVGSWPGVDAVEAQRVTFGELGDPHLPYLPELPARGPGAELVGRGASLLVGLPVDLQPSGWRLVERPGRDLARSRALLRSDLDLLAEVADGYRGPLKIQVAGPWTLAGTLTLPRLERAVADSGACRDLVVSLAEGVAAHVADVRRLVPGAQVVVQLDEPALPAVLAGRVPTSSGLGRLRAVDDPLAVDGLAAVVGSARAGGAVAVVVHCCAAGAPIDALVRAGADAVALDVSLLDTAGWESVAAAVEGGRSLWAGVIPTSGPPPSPGAAADAVHRPWRGIGLPLDALADVVLTPACGLAGVAPARAREVLATLRRAGTVLAERAGA